MNLLDLFAGIGGFSLAASFLDIQVTDAVEINPFCQQVLAKNFPHVKIHSDATTYRGTRNSHNIITAGSPCQNFSLAGDRTGIAGDKSKLILEFFRILGEVQPLGFVLENVPGIYRYLPDVLTEIAKIGLYEVRWFSLSVASLGGAHRRNRVFILGRITTNVDGINGKTSGNQIQETRTNSPSKYSPSSTGCYGHAQPRLVDKLHGIPPKLAGCLMSPNRAMETIIDGLDIGKISDRTAKIEALGNAVTPQQAFVALSILTQWIQY